MRLEDLKEHVWRKLPLRRVIVGRRAVDDMVELAVANWETKLFDICVNEDQRTIVSRTVVASMKRGHQVVSDREVQEYGFVWVIILGAMANLIVQIILHWWMERRANRAMLLGWQAELIG